MWQPLPGENKNFLLQCKFDDTSSIVLITNAIYLWKKLSSNEEIITAFQEQNPLVEASAAIILKQVKNLLDFSKSNSQTNLELKDGKICIKSTSKLRGISLSFSLSLDLMEPKELYDEITAPLLLTIQTLQSQQKYLIELIQKKDVEISEYKLEGNEISRKNIITPLFNEISFFESGPGVELNYSEPSNVISNLNLFREMSNLLKLKKECMSDKSSPITTSAEGLPSPFLPLTNIEPKKKFEELDESDSENETISSENIAVETVNSSPITASNINRKPKKKKLNL